MCVWTSTAPGITYRPVASIVLSASTAMPFPIAATFSPSTRTSAATVSVAVTTVPPWISVFTGSSSSLGLLSRHPRPLGEQLGELAVELRAPIAQELPGVADITDHLEIQVVHEHLVLGV